MDVQVRMGYVESRSIKLLYPFLLNLAVPVDGIPLATATVDQRRPDQRYYSVPSTRNGGIAYLDAAQAAIEFPLHKGIGASASYSFSKAIDLGSTYIGIAASKGLTALCQNPDQCYDDRKSLSDLDSPHALLIRFEYTLPGVAADRGVLAGILSGWQISGFLMAKLGAPCGITEPDLSVFWPDHQYAQRRPDLAVQPAACVLKFLFLLIGGQSIMSPDLKDADGAGLCLLGGFYLSNGPI